MKLRQFQLDGVRRAAEVLDAGRRALFVAPTGTGKSAVELALLTQRPGAAMVTPRVEIVRTLLPKLGIDADIPLSRLEETAEAARIWTPIRLRNRLAMGTLTVRPRELILDEGHHSSASSWEDILHLLGMPAAVAFTATPFRGTPQETARLRDFWGPPIVLITLQEAAAQGYVSLPALSVVPLCDDDVVTISASDFVVREAGELVTSRASATAGVIAGFYRGGFDKATVVALPSMESLAVIGEHLTSADIPWVSVTHETPDAERRAAFEKVMRRSHVLLQIDVVSEGIDLPFERLIDAGMTVSPVRFQQRLGRVMRPGLQSEYICLCRNLERHCYLLAGVYPPEAIAKAQGAFPTPSARSAVRLIGLEAVGRFKASDVRTISGCVARLYQVQSVIENRLVQFAVISHPAMPEPIIAGRVNGADPDRPWARWSPATLPPDLRGFASVARGALTPRMRAFWDARAVHHGLDPTQKVDRHSFAALPILADLRRRLP